MALVGEIRELARVVAAEEGKPVRAEAKASRRASLDLALHPSGWSREQADETIRRYTDLAPVWDGERGGYRPVPLADALRRGGPMPDGLCLEVGCGTGLLSGLIAEMWPRLVSLDLTWAMLSRSTVPRRVLGDAARLPVRDGCARAVVLAVFLCSRPKWCGRSRPMAWSCGRTHWARMHRTTYRFPPC